MKFRFHLVWIFAVTAIVAFAMAFYIRQRSILNDFLPPSTLSYGQLEYEWDPYAEIIVFSADIDLSEADRWYVNNFKVHLHDKSEYDPGQLTIYFSSDSQGRSVSVCLADTSVQRAVDDLDAYVHSDLLKGMIDSKPRLVGVLFMEDEHETLRR